MTKNYICLLAPLFRSENMTNVAMIILRTLNILGHKYIYKHEFVYFISINNKKVLLRERKRHTAHRVVTTPSVVLTGYPPILTWLGGRYPARVPPPQQGTPPPGWTWQGTTPGWTWQRTPPTPTAGPGRVPLPGWTWQGNPPPVSAPWHSGKCCKALWDMGTPPVDRQIDGWMEGQTRVKTLPSRRTMYAGGNNCFKTYFAQKPIFVLP